MVDFYVDRVIKGKKKWTEVPRLWNKGVQDSLIAKGYILNEDGTVRESDEN